MQFNYSYCSFKIIHHPSTIHRAVPFHSLETTNLGRLRPVSPSLAAHMGARSSAPIVDIDDVTTLDALPSATTAEGDAYDFTSTSQRVTLIVNVASLCGLTSSNYADLVALQDVFGDDLLIHAHPCNQFLFQEPVGKKTVCENARRRGFRGVMFDKCRVNGAGASHVFRFLKREAGVKRIPWNFGKFLVDKSGKVRSFHPPHTRPKTLADEIRALVDE